MLKSKIFLLGGLLIFAGCAKLAHIDELLTLQDLSIEQDRQVKFVEDQDKSFELLLKAAENNSFEQYSNQNDFLGNFGPPVYTVDVNENGQQLKKWVYRYSTKAFDSQKIYLYFDDTGRLAKWNHIK